LAFTSILPNGLRVDEKSQIQALNRTAPLLPLRPGIPAQMGN
jgi:hypothetical protein